MIDYSLTDEEIRTIYNCWSSTNLQSDILRERIAKAQNEKTLRLATPEIEAKERAKVIETVDDLLDSMGLGIDDFPLSAWKRWQALKEGKDVPRS